MIIDTKMKRKIEEFLDERGISDIPIRNFGRLLITIFLKYYIGEDDELVLTEEDKKAADSEAEE